MRMTSLRYIFPQAFKSFKNHGWMTFAAIMTMTISIFLCTFFWLLVVNVDANATNIESEVRIVAYILDEIDEDTYPAIQMRIEQLPGVQLVEYVSREQGLQEMESRFGSNLQETLGGRNPLPNRYSITANSPEEVSIVAAAVEQLPQIETVRYGEGSVEKLFAFTSVLRKAGIAIMLLLGLAAVVLIAMTTRVTVYARRKEIMVMKWVGATNAFIRLPFYIEGMIIGIFGAVLAAALVILCYNGAGNYMSSTVAVVFMVPLNDIWSQVILFSLSAGAVMGALGSGISVARFLDV